MSTSQARHRHGVEPTSGAADVPRYSRLRRIASVALAGAGIGVMVMAPLDAAAAPTIVLKGHQFVTAVPGFAPGATVQLRLDRVIVAGTSRADRRGIVHVSMPAPATVGRHQLLLVGAIPSTRPSAADATGAPGDDLQTILVVVPRLVALDFRVVPSLGVDAEQTDRGHHGNGKAAGLGTDAESVTADTGTNVLLPALLGGALVVLGASVLLLGRRRLISRQIT